MAGTPSIKVFDSAGKYQASCHEIEAAACLMGLYGDGATIRFGHSVADIVWTEGLEGQSAMDSYDHVCEVAETRRLDRDIKSMLKAGYTEAQVKGFLSSGRRI